MARLIRNTRRSLSRFWSRVIGLLLGLVGLRTLESCGMYMPPVVMYAPLPASYISGTVTESTDVAGDGNLGALSGIAVTAAYGETVLDESATDINGQYGIVIDFSSIPSVTLTFTDVNDDGVDYAAKTVTVSNLDTDRAQVVDVTLDETSEEENN